MGHDDEQNLTLEGKTKETIEDMIDLFIPESGENGCPVSCVSGEDTTIITLKPTKRETCAMLIGKEGNMARALRTFISAVGRANGKRFILEIVEPEGASRDRGPRRNGGDRRPPATAR